MIFNKKITIPKEMKEITGGLSDVLKDRREDKIHEIKDILNESDDRLLIIVGPCSADDADAVVMYCDKLARLSYKVKEKILIVPRVFTGKPRSLGVGYKGMLHEPVPGVPDLEGGIKSAREMMLRVVKETGLFPADEILYPEDYRYFDDLLVYATIGARSVESQQHRMTASGCDIPVGMKNPLDGNLEIMVQSINAAKAPHNFLYRGWDVNTTGNMYAHAILRGSINRPNYYYEDFEKLSEIYEGPVIVDVNHGNSQKRSWEQPRICMEVLRLKKFFPRIKGLMIESYLEGGCQTRQNVFGKSITDGCLSWEDTEKLIYDIYNEI